MPVSKLGVAGHLTAPTGGIDLLVLTDAVIVTRSGQVRRYEVPDYGTSIGELVARPTAKIGWGQFPDGMEVVYFYDPADDNFGYALNLDDESSSEWGYAPF